MGRFAGAFSPVPAARPFRPVGSRPKRGAGRQFSWLEVGPVKMALSRPTHQRVMPTVGQKERVGINE